ncbi:MAG: regulatory protein RecX [Gemmatimonadota bacterium]|nr:MAG: regulatory protein RecX [Gemmatimonadota bacterium]
MEEVVGSEEAERRAVDAALNFLSYRQRTSWEVRRKLGARGFGQGTIDAAMARLSAVGLVDDEAFVGAYVRDRIVHRPMGVRRMIQELYAKGVAREVASRVIDAVLREEETSERELVMRVVAKKRRTLVRRSEDAALSRRRLRDQLLRRGFDTRVVREAIDELLPRAEE